jgi:hypothetical protein
MGVWLQSYLKRSYPRLLTPDKIQSLGDDDLVRWYRKLKAVRTHPRNESRYDNPKRVRWCFHEARREMVRRGLRNYTQGV